MPTSLLRASVMLSPVNSIFWFGASSILSAIICSGYYYCVSVIVAYYWVFANLLVFFL